VRRQLVGVADPARVEQLATVLARAGTERAWVVSGAGGLDELGLEGESRVAELADGVVRVRTVRAQELGLAPAPTAALRVASAAESARRVRAVLAGERGPARDVVCLNAGAALVVAGVVADLGAGVARAAAAIDSGAARAVLEQLVAFTAAAGAQAAP
jgi:anthranilate phosphoribosyltransferase